MLKIPRYRPVLVLAVALFFLAATTQTGVAQRGRVQRNARTTQQSVQPSQRDAPPSRRPVQPLSRDVAKAEAPKPLTTEQFLTQLTELCDKAKSDIQVSTEKELALNKARLLKAVNDLLVIINKDPKRESAARWKELLGLDALKAALVDAKPLDYAVAEDAWQRFTSDEKGTNWTIFVPVRTELQRYLVLAGAAELDNFDDNFAAVCENLIHSTERYLETADVQDAAAVSGVLDWLDAFTPYQANVDAVVRLVRRQLSGVNVQVQVDLPFLAAGFREKFAEEFDISEQISGTAIRGTGKVSGSSSLTLVPRNDLVELKVLVNAEMESQTTGNHPPVTVKTLTSGTLTGAKSILFSPEKITSIPAVAKASLTSKNLGTSINGGAIVQNIARQQIAEQRPATEAEARRRAEKRLSDRIDRQVDEQLAIVNKNFQEKVRKPLLAVGFFPQFWQFLSTEETINVLTTFASASQTTTAAPPPNQDLKADLIVRVHQSALNNAASIFLGGRTVYEDDFIERFKGDTEDLPKLFQRKEGDVQINPTFALNNPISISFVDNEIKAVFRITDFNLEQPVKQQSDITFRYGIKVLKETGTDGKERAVVVFEQLDEPQATAPDKDFISATDMPVQRRVMTRLKESVQTRIELQPLEPMGRWDDGKLVPVFASTENGWLTLAWNWVPEK